MDRKHERSSNLTPKEIEEFCEIYNPSIAGHIERLEMSFSVDPQAVVLPNGKIVRQTRIKKEFYLKAKSKS